MEYGKGKENVVADALPRAPVEAAALEGDFDYDEAMDCDTWWFNVAGENLGEGEDVAALDDFLPQSRAWWHQHQLQHDFCQKTEQRLVRGEEAFLRLHDDLLYYQTTRTENGDEYLLWCGCAGHVVGRSFEEISFRL